MSPNYSGSDSFTYKANDGTADSNVATVSITVNANQPPVADNDSYNAQKSKKLTVSARGVLDGDTDDVDTNSLTAVTVSNPSHGKLTLNSNGSFTYTPTRGYTGPDSFTYKARDLSNALSNEALVSITVLP